jgi:hypothetical protein
MPDPDLSPATHPPDAMKPGFHCARAYWIRGLMAFKLVSRRLVG